MKIGDVQTTPSRPDPHRGGAVGESGQAEQGAPTRINSDGPAPASFNRIETDRIELSPNARAAHAGDHSIQELALARKALLELPSLTGERAADILERIQEGYYSQPEALERIVERFTEELSGSL